VPIDIGGTYERAAERGYQYGPLFRGLRRAWRRGTEVFADVELPDGDTPGPEEFVLHPALLDAALHAIAHLDLPVEAGHVLLPFAWEGVAVHAIDARSLRVALTMVGDHRVRARLDDAQGNPVAQVDALTLRGVPLAMLRPLGGIDDSLFIVDWVPLPEGTTDEDVEMLRCTADDGVWPVVEQVRDRLAAGVRLAVVTCGAVARFPTSGMPASGACYAPLRPSTPDGCCWSTSTTGRRQPPPPTLPWPQASRRWRRGAGCCGCRG